jgi:hypothetical protein
MAEIFRQNSLLSEISTSSIFPDYINILPQKRYPLCKTSPVTARSVCVCVRVCINELLHVTKKTVPIY